MRYYEPADVNLTSALIPTVSAAITERFANETIAGVADRQEMDGLGGIGFERLSQLPQHLVRGSGVHMTRHFPDVFQQTITRNHLALVHDEILQHFHLQLRQANRLAGHRNFIGLEIDIRRCQTRIPPFPQRSISRRAAGR